MKAGTVEHLWSKQSTIWNDSKTRVVSDNSRAIYDSKSSTTVSPYLNILFVRTQCYTMLYTRGRKTDVQVASKSLKRGCHERHQWTETRIESKVWMEQVIESWSDCRAKKLKFLICFGCFEKAFFPPRVIRGLYQHIDEDHRWWPDNTIDKTNAACCKKNLRVCRWLQTSDFTAVSTHSMQWVCYLNNSSVLELRKNSVPRPKASPLLSFTQEVPLLTFPIEPGTLWDSELPWVDGWPLKPCLLITPWKPRSILWHTKKQKKNQTWLQGCWLRDHNYQQFSQNE